jgi:hypothetical protein
MPCFLNYTLINANSTTYIIRGFSMCAKLNRDRNLIGDRVRQARHAVNPKITQEDLLARLEVRGIVLEKTAVSKIEAKTRPVTDIELVTLAEALGVSILWLLSKE